MDRTPSICFYPDYPQPWSLYRQMRRRGGWVLTPTPEEADWRVLHRNQTRIELAPDDPYATESWTWINGRCRDISKALIQQTFEDIFGYPLAVDPRAWEGPCVQKTDANNEKRLEIVQGPLPEPVPGMVYERLIDSRLGNGQLLELRISVIANTIPLVRLNYRRSWIEEGRLDNVFAFVGVCPPERVLTAKERVRILAFASMIGLDVGELDALRDNESGRLYIVDANNTPGLPSRRTSRALLRYRTHVSIAAFVNGFPSALTGERVRFADPPKMPKIPGHPPIPKLPKARS